jgi:hypothetical protein
MSQLYVLDNPKVKLISEQELCFDDLTDVLWEIYFQSPRLERKIRKKHLKNKEKKATEL